MTTDLVSSSPYWSEAVEAATRALVEADGLTWDEARAPQGDQGTQAEAYSVGAEDALLAALAVLPVTRDENGEWLIDGVLADV